MGKRKKSNFYRWYDEPDNLSVRIEPIYFKNLMEKAVKKVGSVINLANSIGISEATVYNYLSNIGLSMRGLKSILDFLNIKYTRINHKIECIGWNSLNLKIDLDSIEMAIILSASLADGHINNSHFMYKNKNLELIKLVENCVKKLFRNNVKINHRTDRNGTPYILCSSFVRRQLERLGSPRGKKLFYNPRVPKLIREGSLSQKKYFIRQFFDDEGWPESTNRNLACSQSSDTTSILPKEFIRKLILKKKVRKSDIPKSLVSQILKPNLLVDIKKILEKDFKINTVYTFKGISKYKTKKGIEYVSARWTISCSNKEGILNFYKKIGFSSSEKQNILKNMIFEPPLPRYITCKLLNLAIKFHKENKSFRVKDFREHINLNSNALRKRLNVLVKQNILYNNSGVYKLRLRI